MAAAAVNYLVTQAVNNIEMGEYAFAKCYLLTAAEIQPDNLDIKVCNINSNFICTA